MEHLNMEDYLKLGPLDALRVIKAITGSPKANLVGYCLGGTLLSIVLAYLEAIHDDSARPASGTFFTALQDFAEIGETAIFISEEWVSEIEKRTASKGYTDAIEMGSIFRLLRSNDLIWNFVVNNYLLGKEPLAFDLMYWSVDGTRMPRTCHLYYLRNMYLENNLIKPNQIQMLGTGIDLSRVRCPCYVVAGTEDHIVPWRSAHRARALFSGPVRRVLSHGGHITSIINAPPGKGSFLTNESDSVDPDQWLKSARRTEGSWWTDWAKWLGELSGDRCTPPTMGDADHPPLVKAPGTYVLQG
jgi:polyhydroxyalkanoate synthase